MADTADEVESVETGRGSPSAFIHRSSTAWREKTDTTC